jgi:hypothetical protein
MGVPEPEILVFEWIGSHQREETYALAEIEKALSRFVGETPTDLSVSNLDGSHIGGGGHDGRFVLVFSPNDGDENWHAETAEPQVGELPDLVVGGQGADYPAEMRITLRELTQAVLWYLNKGGRCPALTWVLD